MNSLAKRKCALRKCGEWFQPKTYWHRFHDRKCQVIVNNDRIKALIKQARAAHKVEAVETP